MYNVLRDCARARAIRSRKKEVEKYTYLEADLIAGLFGIAFDGVGRSHSWGVDGTIVGNDESVTSIVQFQPI